MLYLSTRGGEKDVSFSSAVINGLANDGGLYVPESFPFFSEKDIKDLSHLDYPNLAYEVTKNFISSGDIPADKYKEICIKTYDNQFSKKIIDISKLNDNEYILNLFHGPTLAFKDYALQLLGNIYEYILEKEKIRLTIIGATSGDTGSAAIHGCSKSKKVNMFILFPHGKVSEIQRKQMTTFNSKNVYTIAVKGNFDDCQKLVKDFFKSNERKRLKLAAINSINWVRIMGQIVYYFWSYFRVSRGNERINYVVPTGNFGNVYAGYVCKRMGLPIDKLIICSNKNDILTRFFESGKMLTKEAIKTLSPSMDIQVSSNFERLLYNFYKKPLEIRNLFRNLEEKGVFEVDTNVLNSLKNYFKYGRLNDEDTLNAIKTIHNKFNLIIDPHTAVGYAVGKKILADNMKRIYLATAHYSKFIDSVKKVVKEKTNLPKSIEGILKKKEDFYLLNNELDDFIEFVKERSGTT